MPRRPSPSAKNIAAAGSLWRPSRRSRQPDNCQGESQGAAQPKEQSRPSRLPAFQARPRKFFARNLGSFLQPRGVGTVPFSLTPPPGLKSQKLILGGERETLSVFRVKNAALLFTHPEKPSQEVWVEPSFLVSFFLKKKTKKTKNQNQKFSQPPGEGTSQHKTKEGALRLFFIQFSRYGRWRRLNNVHSVPG